MLVGLLKRVKHSQRYTLRRVHVGKPDLPTLGTCLIGLAAAQLVAFVGGLHYGVALRAQPLRQSALQSTSCARVFRQANHYLLAVHFGHHLDSALDVRERAPDAQHVADIDPAVGFKRFKHAGGPVRFIAGRPCVIPAAHLTAVAAWQVVDHLEHGRVKVLASLLADIPVTFEAASALKHREAGQLALVLTAEVSVWVVVYQCREKRHRAWRYR